MNISLGLKRTTPQRYVLISLRKLLVIIDRMVAMCLPVLSILTRRSIMLITGFCFVK